jgi:hypothetical protein
MEEINGGDRFVGDDQMVAKESFRSWLRTYQASTCGLTMAAMLQLFGGKLSRPSAYRIARSEGLKGHRRNRTRYERFWSMLNWKLPDTELARIWRVDRGNLRARRVRLGIKASQWRLPRARRDPRYRDALLRELHHAAAYRGPRPA